MAVDGDGVDLAYPNSKTRRGRVGHGVSKTITCADSQGVLVGGGLMPKRVGGLYDKENETHQAGSIYDVGGGITDLIDNARWQPRASDCGKPRARREQRATLRTKERWYD